MEIEGHFPANSGSRLQHFINVRVMNDLKKKLIVVYHVNMEKIEMKYQSGHFFFFLIYRII